MTIQQRARVDLRQTAWVERYVAGFMQIGRRLGDENGEVG